MIVYILQGIGYGFAGAAQPGPFQTYLISKALRQGWRPTLIAALAPLLSDGPIILLVLLVLRQVPDSLVRLLHLSGGALLALLARNAFRRWRQPAALAPAPAPAPAHQRTGRRSLLTAVAMNFLSPGPYLFWSLVAGPTFLAGWRHAPASGIGFLVGFYATLVGTFGATILLFGAARGLGERITRAMIGLSAAALAGFALYQLWLGLGPGLAG